MSTSLTPEPTDKTPPRGADIVLVVEDEAAVRDLVAEILQDLGYEALRAASGPAALPILRSEQRVDLLVTDIGLPGLDGLQLAEAARHFRPDLKVLFITAYAEAAARDACSLASGMDILTKPFSIEALATRVQKMIEAPA